MVRGRVTKDHASLNWKHYCFIFYPGTLATDEYGKTVVGVYAVPPRYVLALVPAQTNLQFCLDCVPFYLQDGCAACGFPVDQDQEHSTCEYLEQYVNGMNRNFRVITFHHNCLPEAFDKVRSYKAAHIEQD
jgi:hypothetical protein